MISMIFKQILFLNVSKIWIKFMMKKNWKHKRSEIDLIRFDLWTGWSDGGLWKLQNKV